MATDTPRLAKKEETFHHGLTEFGKNTIHKYPETETSIADVFFALNNILYPTGRAWQQFDGNLLGALHASLNVSFIRLIEDAVATINSTFPDSELFDESDIELWEYRLGLPTNLNLTLSSRRVAVLRKLAFPNNVRGRQSRIHMESQLIKAGFDVEVIENTPPYQTPDDILGELPPDTQHADDVYHGDSLQHGGANFEIIANRAEPGEDYSPGGDDNLYATFFIVKSSEPGLSAIQIPDIPVDREREFRELVLKLKPAQTVAYVLRE